MTTWYCDPSLPIAGSYNTAPITGGTIPTKPDEGDGKASGIAVIASGIITIGTQLQSGDTISFNGKTFTAGTDFTIGADTTITATNIKNAINGLTATTTWIVGNGVQFRDLFNACSSTNIVTVYTRIGSADWNSITITTSSGGRATVSGFSGGSSGACGWFINSTSLIWPSGTKGKGSYGVMCADPGYSTILNGEKINVRAGNGTTGTTIDFAASAGYSVGFAKRGTSTLPVLIEIDNGTIWTADVGLNAKLIVQFDINVVYEVFWFGWGSPTSATDGGVHVKANVNGDGTRNLVFKYKPTLGASYATAGISLKSYVTLENVETFDGSTSSPYGSLLAFQVNSYNNRRPRLINHKHTFNMLWVNYLFWASPAYDQLGAEVIGGEFVGVGLSSPTGASMFYGNYASLINVDFRGTKFTGFPVGSILWSYNAAQIPSSGVNITLSDCMGVESFQTLHNGCASRNTTNAKISITGIKGNGYLQDSALMHAAWLPGLGFPTLNGLVEDNQPASIRVEIPTSAAVASESGLIMFDTLVFSDHSTAAAKTLVAQFCIDENLSYDTSNCAIHMTYQDSATGSVRYLTTLAELTLAAALPASTDAWYPEDLGRPFYTEGIAKYYNKFKLTLTTPTTVKANSMMRVWLTVHKPSAATARYFFIDPYIVVS